MTNLCTLSRRARCGAIVERALGAIAQRALGDAVWRGLGGAGAD
jgi:hypothetical protein